MVHPVTIYISGIKCDAEDCDYVDDTVSRKNYLEYVDKPCPDCGSVLLTQDDYDAVILLEGVVANFDIDIPADMMGEEKIFDVEMNGTGTIDLVEREEDEETLD